MVTDIESERGIDTMLIKGDHIDDHDRAWPFEADPFYELHARRSAAGHLESSGLDGLRLFERG